MDMNIETIFAFPTDNSLGTDTQAWERPPADAREVLVIQLWRDCRKARRTIQLGFQAALMNAVVPRVRQAGEDTSTAIVALAHAWLFPRFFSCRF
jgi:hypothetical protein